MRLLVGTRDGAYRLEEGQVEKVLEGQSRVCHTGRLGSVAVSGKSLYAGSADWRAIFDGPRRLSAVGEGNGHVLVGTDAPATLFSTVDGDSWQAIELPDRPPVRRHLRGRGTMITGESGAPVKHVGGVPDTPDGIVVGLEGDTLLVSYDGGKTWRERDRGLGADVHEISTVDQRHWLAATGNGLYRTRDKGRNWIRLDTSQTYQQYTYYHGILETERGIVGTGGARMPGSWSRDGGAEGIILIADNDQFRDEPYPGGPAEYPFALAAVEDTLYVGTVSQDLDTPGSAPGRVLAWTDSGWTEIEQLPAGVTSITRLS